MGGDRRGFKFLKNERAILYRQRYGIPVEWGTAVNVRDGFISAKHLGPGWRSPATLLLAKKLSMGNTS